MQWKGCFCKLLVTRSLHAQNPRPRHTRIRISTSFIIILSTPAKVAQVPVLRKPQAHWPSALVQGDVLKAKSCKLRKVDMGSITHTSSNLWLISAESQHCNAQVSKIYKVKENLDHNDSLQFATHILMLPLEFRKGCSL